MPRKMKRVHAPAVSITDAPKGEPLAMPEAGTRSRRGRPATRPETIARQQAEAAQGGPAPSVAKPSLQPMAPEEMRPVTILVLRMVARGIQGDAPTLDEVDLVNGPATAVANKYGMTSRWGPELALLGALVVVGSQMRQRAADNRAKTGKQPKGGADAQRSRGDSGPQGVGQEPGIPLALVETLKDGRS